MKIKVIVMILCILLMLFGCVKEMEEDVVQNSENLQIISQEHDEDISVEEVEVIEKKVLDDNEIISKLNLVSSMNVVTNDDSYFFNSEYFLGERIVYGIFEYSTKLDRIHLFNNVYGKNLNVYNGYLYYVENTDQTMSNTIVKSKIMSSEKTNQLANKDYNPEIVMRFRGVDNLTVKDKHAYFIEGYITSPESKKMCGLNLETGELYEFISDAMIKDFQINGETLYVLVSNDDKSELLEIDITSHAKQTMVQFDEVYSKFAYINEEKIIVNGQNFVIHNLVSQENYIIEENQIILNYNIMNNKLIYTIRIYDDEKSLVTKTLDLSSNQVVTLDNKYINFSVLDDKLITYLVTEDKKSNIYTEELVILNNDFEIIQYVNEVPVE